MKDFIFIIQNYFYKFLNLSPVYKLNDISKNKKLNVCSHSVCKLSRIITDERISFGSKDGMSNTKFVIQRESEISLPHGEGVIVISIFS